MSYASSVAVLDHSVLDALGRLKGQRQPEFVDRVITLFMETALAQLAELSKAAAKVDMVTMHHASHALKSCSAIIGAYALAEQCKELELMARAGSVSDAGARVNTIVQAYRSVEADLISRLARKPDRAFARL